MSGRLATLLPPGARLQKRAFPEQPELATRPLVLGIDRPGTVTARKLAKIARLGILLLDNKAILCYTGS
jgi:hypothetical protein